MILSGEDIHTALAEGRMVIDPPPRKEDIDTTSIDLHIGKPLWIWDPALQKDPALNVPLDQLDYKELSERHLVEVKPDAQGRYQIEPQQVYLASTFEKVEFPVGSRLAGRVEGKSTLARLGLMVHMTAPIIHCGTGLGIITLEMYNHGPFAIEVVPGVSRICQLILEEVTREPEARTGRSFIEQKDAKG